MLSRPMPLLAVLLSACGDACAPPDDTGGPNTPIEVGDFAIGVEYTQLGLAVDAAGASAVDIAPAPAFEAVPD